MLGNNPQPPAYELQPNLNAFRISDGRPSKRRKLDSSIIKEKESLDIFENIYNFHGNFTTSHTLVIKDLFLAFEIHFLQSSVREYYLTHLILNNLIISQVLWNNFTPYILGKGSRIIKLELINISLPEEENTCFNQQLLNDCNTEKFSYLLKENDFLEELKIVNDRFTDNQIYYILSSLLHNKNLTTLHLGNNFNDYLNILYSSCCTDLFAEFISINSTIKFLSIINFEFNNLGVDSFIQALILNKTITSLDLENTYLGTDGLEKLENYKLKSKDLHDVLIERIL